MDDLPDDPSETIKEHIQHEALYNAKDKMVMKFAMTSALYAIFTATTSLLAGYHSNEAMIEQIKASDLWTYYQAKSIKMNLLESRNEILKIMQKTIDPKTFNKIDQYKNDIAVSSEKAKEKEFISENHLKRHMSYARSVTLFQIAIGMTAFAILIKRNSFWYLSMLFALGGFVFFVIGII
ncbi:DUF4337 domain-containing protein [Fluviispira multicolorata]|uniref:DUF4337 family protein n=1 Tax=Fluviispira multicolorata TaxID=2654512 RepID=A0A833JBN8_9BACT|nr:DUF4337 domain-containing protein [Fluviispira multicolorata]KAB8029053.1 DUF4337 family protein [Fluviispira multicolorata]